MHWGLVRRSSGTVSGTSTWWLWVLDDVEQEGWENGDTAAGGLEWLSGLDVTPFRIWFYGGVRGWPGEAIFLFGTTIDGLEFVSHLFPVFQDSDVSRLSSYYVNSALTYQSLASSLIKQKPQVVLCKKRRSTQLAICFLMLLNRHFLYIKQSSHHPSKLSSMNTYTVLWSIF